MTDAIVHNCPDSVIDTHLHAILLGMRGEGEEDISPELVEKIRKIIRLSDENARSFGVQMKLPTESMVSFFLRLTWSEKRQFLYIIDDLLEYSKEDGMDCAEMEFYYAIQISSINISPEIIPEFLEWAQEWSIGKDEGNDENKTFVEALPTWIENLPTEMESRNRVY